MSIAVEIWEDTGPILSGHGTTREEVTNTNWKSTGNADSLEPYFNYPITRPFNSDLFTVSYTKYTYAKIYGTYKVGFNLRWELDGEPLNNTQLILAMRSIYTQPVDTLDGTLIPYVVGQIMIPNLSIVGPEMATSRPNTIENDTTYYTSYIVSQLIMKRDDFDKVGNTNPVTFKIVVDEFY